MQELTSEEHLFSKQPKLDLTQKSSHKRRKSTDVAQSPLHRYFKITNSTTSSTKDTPKINKSQTVYN